MERERSRRNGERKKKKEWLEKWEEGMEREISRRDGERKEKKEWREKG